MRKLIVVLAACLTFLAVGGQAMAYFEDGHLIRVVYQIGGPYEVATDLGAFAPATASFTADPFPVVGSGAFSTASWADLQVAYYVKDTTANQIWISGPQGGQVSGSRQYAQFSNNAAAVNNRYAQMGTAQGELLETDLNSYYQRMDGGDYTFSAGRWGGFIQQTRYYGEANLAPLANPGGYVDSYLYYYPTPTADGAQTGIQAAVIRTFSDGHTAIVEASAANNCAATLNPDLSVHLPIATYHGMAFSLDFQYEGGTGVVLTNLESLDDTTAFAGCEAATMSDNLVLHIPVMMYSGVSYWVDLQYMQDLDFEVTGAGSN